MANNTYKNKVVYNGTTLIDLTGDTAIASDVAQGKLFHLPTGEQAVGTATSGGGGVDGDDLEYGAAVVGSAIVGTAVITS